MGAGNTVLSFNWGAIGVNEQLVGVTYASAYKKSLTDAVGHGVIFKLGITRENAFKGARTLADIPDHRKLYVGDSDKWLVMYDSSISSSEAGDIRKWLITTTPRYVANAAGLSPKDVSNWLGKDARFMEARAQVDRIFDEELYSSPLIIPYFDPRNN